MKDKLIVVKVTEDCNLSCKYCYRPNSIDKSQMSETTLRNVLSNFLNYNDLGIVIVWHGGEPCLVGKEFFQRAIEIENELNHKNLIINNQIQTNGILLNEDMVSFLKSNGFKVGVSFDGLR